MAIPSNIPTSFVPPSSTRPRRFRTDLTGAFDFLAYIIFACVFALAIGVFFYERILVSRKATKDASLTQAEAGVDRTTVESFVQLRDRLSFGKVLLSDHVAFSRFFSLLNSLTPSTVRYSSLHLSLDDTGAVKVFGSGTAKNFNALAATSASFAKDGRITDALFSDIKVNKTGSSVSFKMSASINRAVIAFSAEKIIEQAGTAVGTSTATTATTTP